MGFCKRKKKEQNFRVPLLTRGISKAKKLPTGLLATNTILMFDR
jgi:hypothetical protein